MQTAVPPDWPAERQRRLDAMFHDRLGSAIGRYRLWHTLVILVIGYCLAVGCQGWTFLQAWPWAQFLLGYLPAWLAAAALFSPHLHLRLFGLGAAFAGSLLIVGDWLLAVMGQLDRGRPFILVLMLIVLLIAVAGLATALRQAQLELRYWLERGPANRYAATPPAPAGTATQCATQVIATALLLLLHLTIVSRLPLGTIFVPSFFETVPGLLCALTGMGLLLYGLSGPYWPLKLVSIGAAGCAALFTLWYALCFWLPSQAAMPTAALNIWLAGRQAPVELRYIVLGLLAAIAAGTLPAAHWQMRAALHDRQVEQAAAGPLAQPADEAITADSWDEAPPSASHSPQPPTPAP